MVADCYLKSRRPSLRNFSRIWIHLNHKANHRERCPVMQCEVKDIGVDKGRIVSQCFKGIIPLVKISRRSNMLNTNISVIPTGVFTRDVILVVVANTGKRLDCGSIDIIIVA